MRLSQEWSLFLRVMIASGLWLIGLGCQNSTGQPEINHAPLSQPGESPETNSTTTSSPVPVNESEITLQVVTAASLRSLTRDDFMTLNQESEALTQSWFDLAGLDKLIPPPVATDSLLTFRQTWQARNPEVAPFLGSWHDDASAGQLYTLNIFPSSTAGQVCILESRAEWKVVEDVILEPILTFSTATASNRQLLGSRLRSAEVAIVQEEFFTGEMIELMGVMDAKNTVRLFAAQALPGIPSELSPTVNAAIQAELDQQGCTAAVPDTTE